MHSVSYIGLRENGLGRVLRYRPGQDPAHGTPLSPRLDLRAHSPSGLDWGYQGSAPAQLALALLADYLQDEQVALALYQPFKVSIVATLPAARWLLTEHDLDQALATLGHTYRCP